MYVKKINITSGSAAVHSNQKIRWDLYGDDNKCIGCMFQPIYFEVIGWVGTYYPACSADNYRPQLYSCMFDAVKAMFKSKKSVEFYDSVCELFFNEGFKLVP